MPRPVWTGEFWGVTGRLWWCLTVWWVGGGSSRACVPYFNKVRVSHLIDKLMVNDCTLIVLFFLQNVHIQQKYILWERAYRNAKKGCTAHSCFGINVCWPVWSLLNITWFAIQVLRKIYSQNQRRATCYIVINICGRHIPAN